MSPPPSFFLPVSLTITGMVTRNKVTLPLSGNTFQLWSVSKSELNCTPFFAYLERFQNRGYLFMMCLAERFIGVLYKVSQICLIVPRNTGVSALVLEDFPLS